MFQDACARYEMVFCNFGGGSPDIKGKLHGLSCLLSPIHVLTAAHNVRNAMEKYAWPVVSKFDGLFKCESLWASEEWDIAILQATDLISPANHETPDRYPVISYQPIKLGMTVGYLSWLHKNFVSRRSMVKYFSSAHVAFRGESEEGHSRWDLSSGFVEPGFSGTPVFLPDASLVGIVVGATTMAQKNTVVDATIHTSPQISIIPDFGVSLRETIAQAAGQ